MNKLKDIFCFFVGRLNIKGTWLPDSKVYMKEEIITTNKLFRKMNYGVFALTDFKKYCNSIIIK